ncbi:hypothetical protein D3C80_1509670 [compost metagenome]
MLRLHRNTIVRIGLAPGGLLSPVVVFVDCVDDTEIGVVLLGALQDVQGVCAMLVADAGLVGACCGDRANHGLVALACASFNGIVHTAVAVSVEFVDEREMDVLTVERISVSRQSLEIAI